MLTEKQATFCREYLVDLNASRAAERAGYTPSNARFQGSELLALPEVQSEIQRLMDERKERTRITADRVLQELARIAFGDPRAVVSVDDGGKVVITPSRMLSDDDAAMIAEVSETTTANGGSTKIKLHNKLDALEKLGKHLKLFTDVQEVRGNVTVMPAVVVHQPDGTKKTLTFDIGRQAKDDSDDSEGQ